ncbi:MAG TPA: DUF3179 domain-containing protein [Thermoanaerobaculia bacterium]|nr:DUF3179 domain-containing protein [Thermoanaerobaculia bacterium]
MRDDRLPRRPGLRAAGAGVKGCGAGVFLALLLALPAAAQEAAYATLRGLFSEFESERRAAARELAESRDSALVPGLVDTLFFLPRARRAEAVSALEALTGERAGERYHDWVELVARRPDLRPREGYADWKGELFARIDPRYREIIRGHPEGAPARIRLEEVVWGGVPPEGIPALDRPRAVPADQAGYLEDGERVFGISIGGEQRAYPLRILGWHEMVNDVVGGEPFSLSYCTLCGSGVLFGTHRQGAEPFTFGTSGLLYRSNKLMIDRQTGTLWSNLTGEPVLGQVARDPEGLPVLPLTLTTWQDWRTRNPRTTVLALDRRAAARWGYDYSPGAADNKRRGVSFPSGPGGQRASALEPGAEIFAVRLRNLAKAYPVDLVLRERVVNDRLGENPLVVVGDSQSGAVRAYRSGGRTFAPGSRPGELVDGTGGRWTAGEDTLAMSEPRAPGGPEAFAPLERIPGHQAFWFGWFSFFPESELYRGQEPSASSRRL